MGEVYKYTESTVGFLCFFKMGGGRKPESRELDIFKAHWRCVCGVVLKCCYDDDVPPPNMYQYIYIYIVCVSSLEVESVRDLQVCVCVCVCVTSVFSLCFHAGSPTRRGSN